MKKIPIKYKNEIHYALVDRDDYEKLKDKKWTLNRGYAVISLKIETIDEDGITRKQSMSISMHSFIMNTHGHGTNGNKEVDHINMNRLDNRRCNLRRCTRSQNMANRKMNINNISGFKGVSVNKEKYLYTAIFKHKVLGSGTDPIELAKKYDEAARKEYGEFARTNF